MGAASDIRPIVRNVGILAVCQALFFMANTIQFSTSGLVGTVLAMQFVGILTMTMPASLLMQRVGRGAGFRIGSLFAIVAGLLGAWATYTGSFVLFCVAGILYGSFGAFANYLRFAAADAVDITGHAEASRLRPKAIAWVMAGGLVAAVVGPEIAKHTRDLIPPVTFVGCYLAVAVVGAVMLLVAGTLRLPPMHATAAHDGPARSTVQLVRDPTLVTAFLAALIAYVTMNLLMTATPLEMLDCGLGFGDTAFVIQWHVVGMFLPSFWTGRLIARFGARRIIATGALINVACVLVNLGGVEVARFAAGLFLLGIGWNLMFIGGTTLLTESYRPAEKAKAQGLNDMIMFTTVAVSALSAGALHATIGWQAMNIAAIPAVLLILLLLRLSPAVAPVGAAAAR